MPIYSKSAEELCDCAVLMNAPVNDSVLHKYRCHTRHLIPSCFLGHFPTTAYAEGGEGKILHMSNTNTNSKSCEKKFAAFAEVWEVLVHFKSCCEEVSQFWLCTSTAVAKGLRGNKSLLLS